MENASKALIIAGAILISILLIAIGMYIYSGSTGAMDSAVSKMSQQEKDIYNADITPYIGDNIRGSQVRQMIDRIISNNQGNAGQPGKFISVTVEGTITGYNNLDDLNSACLKCDYYSDGGTGDNSEANVAAATSQMNTLKSKINTSKGYTVSSDQAEGAIYKITIKPNS